MRCHTLPRRNKLYMYETMIYLLFVLDKAWLWLLQPSEICGAERDSYVDSWAVLVIDLVSFISLMTAVNFLC